MSTPQTNPNAPVAPVITRNEVDKTLTSTVFGKLSKLKGKTFFFPSFDVSNPDDVKWAGNEVINDAVDKVFRRIFGELYSDNIIETGPNAGQLNYDAWKAAAEDFTAGAQTLSSIKGDIEELSDLQYVYSQDENFGATDAEGKPTADAEAIMQKIQEVGAKIKPLRAKKQQIEQKYAAIVAKRKAAEEAEAAAKGANAQQPAPAMA